MKQILIYGPRKSGTTLLQRLLDGGDVFVHHSETRIARFLEYQKSKDTETSIQNVYHKYESNDHFDFQKYKTTLLSGVRQNLSLKEFIELDVAASQESMIHKNSFKGWAVKTVGGSPNLVVNSFLEAFPDGLVVMIIRNPKFITRAIYTDRKRRKVKISLFNKIMQASTAVNVSFEQKKFSGNPRVFTTSFESLVEKPEDEMRKILEFLNLKPHENHKNPTLNGQSTIVKTASTKTSTVFNSRKKLSSDISKSDLFIIQTVYSLSSLYNRAFK